MKPKTVDVNIIKQVCYRTRVEYRCPKCYRNVVDHSFDYNIITRFRCSCGQEIIANYIVHKEPLNYDLK